MNRLTKAAIEEARRRGRNLPEGSTAARWRMEKPCPAKSTGAMAGAADPAHP